MEEDERINRQRCEMMRRIMIVEDHEELKNELITLLVRNGYDVCEPSAFDTVPNDIKQMNPHLILLDINLPSGDGFRLCSEIRCFSKEPIIFVTGRDTDMDELTGITLGGDDFITKPYNAAVLLARISALLKRAYPNDESGTVLEHKSVILNLAASKIKYRDQEIELTKTEAKILHCLFVNRGEITLRSELMDRLWDNNMFVDDNALSVNMTRIRGKLSSIGIEAFILTKRGLGYSL